MSVAPALLEDGQVSVQGTAGGTHLRLVAERAGHAAAELVADLAVIGPQGIDQAREKLLECNICPRNCIKLNRLQRETGFCKIGIRAVVSSANPHFGEEAPLVGSGGSGTIFMTSCNLKCVFCQNYEISHLMEGEEVDTPTFGGLMVGLQRLGCHNINFVTPSHVVPHILEAVKWGSRRRVAGAVGV